ncbi:hypothetical protein ACIHAA_21880 [Streptomyces sp. NPDC052040]|uniref:hypothetical protein n=1 Tax=unclassified Streptomyces TaxID=2593676 RepID=UPI0037D3B24B
MYGHGAAPPPTRTPGAVITLRVLFVVAGFLSCGLLTCLPLFRIAVLRGRTVDWLLAWLSLPVSIGCLAFVGSVPENDHRGDLGLTTVLVLGAASGAYFLVFDIRRHRGLPPGAPVPPRATGYTPPPPGYGYPAAGPYPAAPPTPAPPSAPVRPPLPPYGSVPPPPQRPAPARIDQVRAELDELSDYLRRHEDGR